MNRRADWITAAIAAPFLLLAAGCAEQTAEAPSPRPIAWTEVQAWSGSEQRRLPGLVRAAQRAPLSFEVPGRVAQVKLEIGERFDAGEMLATLDTRSFRLTLEERRASLADARATLTKARQTLARKRELVERDVGSRAALDDAQAAYDSSQAQVNRLQALVGLAREDLQDATLNAPYAGEILQRMIEPSQQVQAGQTVFQVQGKQGGLEVIVSAPETVVNRLQRGAQAQVHFPARPATRLTATVTEIGAGAVQRNAFPVTLALSGAPEGIRPGMTAEVGFSLNGRGDGISNSVQKPGGGAVVIPATAFLAGENQTTLAFVFKPETQTVHQRKISLADIDTNQAIVASGLQAGEIVATKGLPYLTDGEKVTLLNVGVRRYQQ